MFVPHVESIRCPHCGSEEGAEGPVHSGLGPSWLACRKCGGAYRSRRLEWAEFNGWGRARYVLLSVVYVLFLAYLGSVSGGTAYQFIRRGRFEFQVSDVLPGVLTGAATWAAFTAAIQLRRVRRSIARTRQVNRQPFRPTWWDLDTGLAGKFLVLVFALPLTLWALAVIASVVKSVAEN